MRFIFKLFFTLLTTFFAFTNSYATHNMGKDMRYTCLGLVNGQMQYKVTVVYYRNCWDAQQGQAASAPSYVSLEVRDTVYGFTLSASLPLDTNALPANGSEIEQLCAAQYSSNGCNWTGAGNPPYPGAQVYTYTDTINVPAGCQNIILGTTDCCRNGAVNNITTAGSRDLSIIATINNSIDANTGLPYSNNSAQFNALPIVFYCVGALVTYNHSSVDVDGDSLVYSMVNPMDGASLPYADIAFSAGYSVTNPVRSNTPFIFNSSTGQMDFTPAFIEQDVMAIRVDEYRKGVLVGSTMRDIQFVVLNCAVSNPVISNIKNLQNAYLADSVTVELCPGNNLQLDILTTDPNNRNLTVSSNVNSIPSTIPGATLTTTGTGNTVTTQLQWTPQANDTGLHYFVVTATNDDCPLLGKTNKAFAIRVVSKAHLLAGNASYCGQPVRLNASGGGNFKWWPVAGLSDTTVLNPMAAPSAPVVYHFQSDCGADSVFVNVSQPFTLEIGSDTVLCNSDSLLLHAVTNSPYSGLNYIWSAINGTVFSANQSTSRAHVRSDDWIYCYVADSLGCIVSDSMHVMNRYRTFSALVSADSICSGSEVILHPVLLASNEPCGLAATSCAGTSATVQVGSGTVLMPASNFGYPALYGKFKKGVRTQILYTKADLVQLLGGSGQISGIGFEIGLLNSASPIENFEIKIACTQATSLSTWLGNLASVYSDSSYTPVSGWNYHPFDNAYNWDGTSNLVIEICSYNPTSAVIPNNKIKGATVSYSSVLYSAGSTIQCGLTGTPVASSFLPNVKFDFCRHDISGAGIVWSSALQPNTVTDSTSLNPVIAPLYTDSYQFNISDSICAIQSSNAANVSVFALPVIDSLIIQNAPCNSAWGAACVYVSGGNSYLYTWPVTGQSADACDTVVPVGINTISVLDNNGCRVDSIFAIDSALSLAASFSIYPDSSLAHNWFAISQVSDTTANYLWEWGDGTTSTGQYPSHIYAAPGFYNICLTVSDGVLCPTSYCDSSTYLYKNEEEQAMVSVNVVSQLPAYTGVSEKYESPVWSVYPVPASDRINLSTGGKVIERVRIYNHVGRLMLESINPVGNEFNVKDFAPGVYIAEVKAGGLTSRMRWIKL